MMAQYGSDRGDHHTIRPSDVTALWRLINTLRKQPAENRARLFDQLAVKTDAQRLISELLHRLGDINVLEPGVFVDDPGCALGWQPSVLAPAFYGFTDVGTADGLPARVRVFFPSVDGSPQHAQILTGCGRYPLVAFLHGECDEPDRHLKWDLVPAQLARSGYIVAVPELSNVPPFGGSDADIDRVEQVLLWMRAQWAHAASLMPPPLTAIVGHSWGALLGGVVATRLQARGAISAYASLSGGWLEWPPSPPRPLRSLNMATMFMWGTGLSDLFANLDGANAAVWNEPLGATHKVVFRDGEHWDYLREGATTCAFSRGPCSLTRAIAADFLTTFLSHYMPPQKWTLLNVTIPHSLLPPALDLTPQQEFFAGGHLTGLSQIDSSSECAVTHTWRLPPFGGGSITLGAT